MKYALSLCITILGVVHAATAMEPEQPKKPNLKGIIPLFDTSDTQAIKRFDRFHTALVHHLDSHLYEKTEGNHESFEKMVQSPSGKELVYLLQGDLYSLRNQCTTLRPEKY